MSKSLNTQQSSAPLGAAPSVVKRTPHKASTNDMFLQHAINHMLPYSRPLTTSLFRTPPSKKV